MAEYRMKHAVDALCLKATLATGANANTDITVTGITTSDVIIGALHLTATHNIPYDVTDRMTITDTNDVQCTDSTASGKVLVLWHDASGQGIASPCLKWAQTDGKAASTNMAISGIATDDTLLMVMALTDTTAAWADDLAQCSITSSGNIQSTTDNSSKTLLVLYHDADGQGYGSTKLGFGIAMGAAATQHIFLDDITTSDALIAVQELAVTSGLPTDRTAEASIYDNGTIHCSTTSTANDYLLCLWQDKTMKDPPYDGSPIRFAQVAGTTATTDITVPDITAEDSILWCYEQAQTSAIPTDRTAETSITADRTIQLATTDTSNDTLEIGWWDASRSRKLRTDAPASNAGLHFQMISGGGAAAALAVTGITTDDELCMVLETAASSNIPTDRTREAYISADGYIKVATATTGDKLWVIWHEAGEVQYKKDAIKFTIAAGAGASSDITVTGITTSDKLMWVLESAASTADFTDRTSTTSITDTNDIQCTVATTGDKMLIWWYDVSA